MVKVKAHLRFARISPKKVRLALKGLRGRSPVEVAEEFKFMPQKAAFLVRKLINSAVSNARNNLGLNPEGLVIKEITADSGTTYKRHWLRSRGQVDLIRKRTSHLSVVLGERTKQAVEKKNRGEKQPAAVKTKPRRKATSKNKEAPSTKH